MIVIADTSPLNYLIQIECDSLLATLYRRVIVPNAVIFELRHAAAPPAVSAWLTRIPAWLEVRSVTSQPDPALAFLDPGEREAIQLAEEQHADLLLIDERRARAEAMRRGMTTTGTLGILLAAGARNLIDAAAMYHRLVTETNFRTTPELHKVMLQKFEQFRKKDE